MQKTEAQHKETHNPPAQRQGGGKALESPQGEQITQLEAVVESSPQAGKMAQLASTANASSQAAAQRGLMDMIHNSPRMAAQRKALDAIHTSPHVTAQRQQLDSFTAKPAQLEEADEETLQPKVAQREEAPAKPNNTGLPDNLKHGIESLSGLSMDNVKVHYNSSQPAQLNALAYAQGTDIHVAPGQEKHLPHEAWHVVQQAQGRVQPTTQMKSGVSINDDARLEREADVMGERAVSVGTVHAKRSTESVPIDRALIQAKKKWKDLDDNEKRDAVNIARSTWLTLFSWNPEEPFKSGPIGNGLLNNILAELGVDENVDAARRDLIDAVNANSNDPKLNNAIILDDKTYTTQNELIRAIQKKHRASEDNIRQAVNRIETGSDVNKNGRLKRIVGGEQDLPTKLLQEAFHASFGMGEGGCTLFFTKSNSSITLVGIGYHEQGSKRYNIVWAAKDYPIGRFTFPGG